MNNQNMIDTVTRISGVNPQKVHALRQMLRQAARRTTRWNTIRTSSSPWSKTGGSRS